MGVLSAGQIKEALLTFERIGDGLWFVFILGWWLAQMWTARGVSKASIFARAGYFIAFGLGFGLLFGPAWVAGYRASSEALWRAPLLLALILLAVEVVGLGFAVWARLHLGKLWSGMLTLREGHRVVDTGPYAWVRHPIYTGFILAAWALALIGAEPSRLLGALVLTVVMTTKAGVEERLLRRELGAAAYDAYAARTPMLIPRLSRSVRR